MSAPSPVLYTAALHLNWLECWRTALCQLQPVPSSWLEFLPVLAVSKHMHIKVLVGVIIQGLNVNGHDAVGNCSAQHISQAKWCVLWSHIGDKKKRIPLWVAESALEVLDDSHVKSSGQHLPWPRGKRYPVLLEVKIQKLTLGTCVKSGRLLRFLSARG